MLFESPDTPTALYDREQRPAYFRDADDGSASTSGSMSTLRRRSTDRRGESAITVLDHFDETWMVTPSNQLRLSSIIISGTITADDPAQDRRKSIENATEPEAHDVPDTTDDEWFDSDPQIAAAARQRISLLAKRFAARLQPEELARLEIVTAKLDVLAPVITDAFSDGVDALRAARERIDSDVARILADLE